MSLLVPSLPKSPIAEVVELQNCRSGEPGDCGLPLLGLCPLPLPCSSVSCVVSLLLLLHLKSILPLGELPYSRLLVWERLLPADDGDGLQHDVSISSCLILAGVPSPAIMDTLTTGMLPLFPAMEKGCSSV